VSIFFDTNFKKRGLFENPARFSKIGSGLSVHSNRFRSKIKALESILQRK
jgi:hypothetical protein